MTFKNKITNVQPLIPGGTTTITIGTGAKAPTMDRLQLILAPGASGTFNVSKINAIRCYANGRPFYVDGTGTVHNARRDYLGLFTATSELVLDFTEPNAKTAVEQYLSAIPLSMLQDFRVELDIDASASSGFTVAPIMHFRPPTQNPFIKKQFRMTQGFSAAGEQVIYLPNGPSGGKLVRVWIHEATAGNITSAELKARNVTGLEGTRVQFQNSQKHFGLVPQSGVLVMDFIEDGNLNGWFDTGALSEVELRLQGTAADAYTVYLEYLDPIGHL